MTVPTRPAELGASSLARDVWIDVLTSGPTVTPEVWTPIMGCEEDIKGAIASKFVDDSDNDSGGDGSETKVSQQNSLTFTVRRKATADDATVYDPGQEFLRLKAELVGAANSVTVRWYEMGGYGTDTPGPRVEAYRMKAGVEWSPDNDSGLLTASITLHGQGKRTSITHPDAA
jgi:hypothetical protein